MGRIPVVILHGWNLNAAKFLPLEKELIGRGYQVFCPDLPGFGSAEIPDKPYHLSDYVSFMVNYFKERKLPKAILIGHSFGGRIAIKLAAEYPELVHALILTGAPGLNPVPRLKILFFLYLAKTGNVILSLPVLSSIKNQSRKLLYKTAKATDFYNTDKNMRETFKNIVREEPKMYLKDIAAPTLLLWGEKDQIVPPSVAQKMSGLIAHSKLIQVPNAKHGVPWTHPGEFADEVTGFLKKI